MAKGMDTLYLEDWISAPPSLPPLPGVHNIAQAWSLLRSFVQQQAAENIDSIQQAALLLKQHHKVLHITQPQSVILSSLLSQNYNVVDHKQIGGIRAAAARILSSSIRKTREHRETLQRIVLAAISCLEDADAVSFYVSEIILLLGSVCKATFCDQSIRTKCYQVLIRELFIRRKDIVCRGLREALAGIGYLISACHGEELVPILNGLLQLWCPRGDRTFNKCLDDGMMLFRLWEWEGSVMMSRIPSPAAVDIDVISREVLKIVDDESKLEAQAPAVMTAAGLLRSLFRHQNLGTITGSSWLTVKATLESVVVKVAAAALNFSSVKAWEHVHLGFLDSQYHGPKSIELLRVVAISVGKCDGFPSHLSVAFCLLRVVFEDALNLEFMYYAQVQDALELVSSGKKLQYLSNTKRIDNFSKALELLKEHVNGILFHEIGAISRALFAQYLHLCEEDQNYIEEFLSERNDKLYLKHCIFVVLCSRGFQEGIQWTTPWMGQSKNSSITKVLESWFLAMVLFFTMAMKRQMEVPSKAKLAAQVLHSFSCLEFFRSVHLPEYGELVKDCVYLLSKNDIASMEFVSRMPTYNDVIHWPGAPDIDFLDYSWEDDDVQTSRFLFYMRVIPSILTSLKDEVIFKVVVPKIFLYMHHPNLSVVQAAHGLFTTFISLEHSSQLSSDKLLKEQLVPYYMERALEGYPLLTPFDAMASGVAAIVRHLPAGSPAIVHCIDCLVSRVLTSAVTVLDNIEEVSNPSSDSTNAAEKLTALLVHLILLVDMQVLPYLLQQVAKVILSLPKHIQTILLETSFGLIVGCDDYTRRPTIIPWLQSISFLCSAEGSKQQDALL